MTDFNMGLEDLTKSQKIAAGIGLVIMAGYFAYFAHKLESERPTTSASTIRYETAPRTAPRTAQAKDDARSAAELLTGGQRQTDQIRRISNEHKVSPTTVADKAAKAAEICQNQGHAGDLRGWAFGSLTFVDEITEPITLDDAFVTYVLMGCPQ
jgi:hypothetical protein